MRETAVHFIDTFRFLMGEVSAVYARLRKVNPVIAGEDAGYIIFEYESGATGLFDGNRLNDHVAGNPRRTMGEMWLEGSGGVLRLDGEARLWWKPHHGDEAEHAYDKGRLDSFGGGACEWMQRHVIAHLLHGAPLRVITPGWMAESCMKWLTEITVRADETPGYYMQQAYRIPETAVRLSSGLPGSAMVPVERMPVKSLIAAPAEGDTVRIGPVTIQGVAWAGEAPVVKVEVSCDDGKTWEQARLLGEGQPYAWRQWQVVWNARTPGPTAILCRATDAQGEQQPATSPWNPGGFLWNGWDRLSVTVAA